MTRWTEKQVQQLKEEGRIVDYKDNTKKPENNSQNPPKNIPKKRNKYGNVKTIVNGIEFDSEKEANRYRELLFLLKAGIIGLLELQKPFELNQGGTYSYKYFADFVYVDGLTGQTIVEDAKGFRTREFKKKKRLMKKVHGITVMEV